MTAGQLVNLYSVSSGARTVSCTYVDRTQCSQFRRIRLNPLIAKPHTRNYLQVWKNEERQNWRYKHFQPILIQVTEAQVTEAHKSSLFWLTVGLQFTLRGFNSL